MSLADELLADLEDLESDEDFGPDGDDDDDDDDDDNGSEVADAMALDDLITTSVRSVAKLRDSARVCLRGYARCRH